MVGGDGHDDGVAEDAFPFAGVDDSGEHAEGQRFGDVAGAGLVGDVAHDRTRSFGVGATGEGDLADPYEGLALPVGERRLVVDRGCTRELLERRAAPLTAALS